MSEIKKLKINGQEYTITDGGAVVFDEAQELNEEQKEQARENIGAGSGVYVLGEGETEADVPEGVDVLIDPNGEPLVIPQPLVVTITDDVASHTSAEIYAHVQAGGSAVLNETDNWGVTLNYLGGNEDYASFGAWLDEMRMVHATIWSDGAAEFAEPNYANNDDLANKINRPSTAKVGQTIVVKSVHTDGRPIAWEAADLPSDDHINSLIDAKLGVIENGSY